MGNVGVLGGGSGGGSGGGKGGGGGELGVMWGRRGIDGEGDVGLIMR